jgi:hypothetical protein
MFYSLQRLDAMTATQQEFNVVLSEFGDGGYGFVVPFNVPAVFGTRAEVKVCGTIDGVPYRGSIVPHGARHSMNVNRKMRSAIHKTSGDTIHVIMQIDTEPCVVEVPEDLLWALDADAKAKAVFDKFGYSHRREYVNWIESARKAETRARRVQEALRRMTSDQRQSTIS